VEAVDVFDDQFARAVRAVDRAIENPCASVAKFAGQRLEAVDADIGVVPPSGSVDLIR